MIQISSKTRLRRTQLLQRDSVLLARKGQHLSSADTIAEVVSQPELFLLDVSQGLGTRPGVIAAHMQCEPGDLVDRGDIIAGPLGLSRRVVRSPFDGQVVLIHSDKVLLKRNMVPQPITAIYPGEIIHLVEKHAVVIESVGALVEGVWGNGKIAFGQFYCSTEGLSDSNQNNEVGDEIRGTIYFHEGALDANQITHLIKKGIGGLVISSLSPDLVSIGRDLDIAVVVVMGFGSHPLDSHTKEILTRHHQTEVTINGSQNLHFDNHRPELFFPHPEKEQTVQIPKADVFAEGTLVRVVNGKYFGAQGTILRLEGLKVLQNGLWSETAEVQIFDGEKKRFPLASLIGITGDELPQTNIANPGR